MPAAVLAYLFIALFIAATVQLHRLQTFFLVIAVILKYKTTLLRFLLTITFTYFLTNDTTNIYVVLGIFLYNGRSCEKTQH